jgi:hypothetical protein
VAGQLGSLDGGLEQEQRQPDARTTKSVDMNPLFAGLDWELAKV